MSDPVADFLSARPRFDRAHVEQIAASCESEGIPFCSTCHDWHTSDEDHSA